VAGTVDFAGAVAVVTGGATGIGRAVCLGLAARGASAVIVNYSRSRDEALAVVVELEALGCEGRAVQADVRDETAVIAMMDATVAEFGRIDILVNNAGATRLIPFADLDAVTDEVWELVLGVNVRGAFLATRAASAALRAARGAVVNVASTAGHRASGSSIAYGVSKAALLQLTRGLAVALAPEVRVNSVSPGSVSSDWMGGLVGDDVARAAREAESAVIPLGRVSTPEEVADAIIAMLGPGMVTGQDVIVDGGKHLLY
jgi:NAD(P)-dependent dehydrogenase (short-subunit alcohol dehydrogenase family)